MDYVGLSLAKVSFEGRSTQYAPFLVFTLKTNTLCVVIFLKILPMEGLVSVEEMFGCESQQKATFRPLFRRPEL